MIALADLKEWLRIESDNHEHDNVLTALETAAVDFIEEDFDRHFGTSQAFVEHFIGSGERSLWLNEAPSSLTKVEERLRPGDSWTTIGENDTDGWELRTEGTRAKVLRKGGYSWRFNYEYRITYSFGYTSGNEPAEIRQAVKWLVAHWFKERGREGLRTEALGDYSYSIMATASGERDLSMIPGWKRIAARWRGIRAA